MLWWEWRGMRGAVRGVRLLPPRNAAAVVRDGAGAPWLHCWPAGGEWADGARARRVALRVAADRPALDGPSTTGPHLQLLDLRYSTLLTTVMAACTW